MTHSVVGRLVTVLLLSSVPGCVDTSPLPYEGLARDASTEAGPIDAECRECITGQGAPCREAYDACTAQDRCVDVTECLFVAGCFAVPELLDRIVCGQPCFQEHGILDQRDPLIAFLLPLNACTLPGAACGAACVK